MSDPEDAEHRRDFLIKELAHRGKNLLAVVQSIVRRTLRDHPPDEAREILERRLAALARSHAAIAANPKGARLRQIVEEEMEAFSSRVHAEGPDLHLRDDAAQTMGLVLHELATNAVKHGALSHGRGRVAIRWTVSADPNPTFAFEWREHDGPPVTPPIQSGFGRTVLERLAASDFKAAPVIAFEQTGLIYRFEAPLDAIADPDADWL